MRKWKPYEIDILREKFYDCPTKDLLNLLPGRTIKSIQLKAAKMGLIKNSIIKSLETSRRNKILGRDLSKDALLSIARKFSSRSEFQKSDSSAYVTCRNMGILDEACSHMEKKSFSTPQIILDLIISNVFNIKTSYNNRKIISPFEIDIFVDDHKLAFEYDGNYWHHNEDVNKKKLCDIKGVILITIRQKTRNYENDIKTDLCENLDTINKIIGSSVSPEDIRNYEVDYKEVYNFGKNIDIKKLCDSYTDYSTFIIENRNLVKKLRKMGVLDAFTSHMTKKKMSWNEENLNLEIRKYDNLSDLIEKNFKIYLYCRRKNPELLKDLKYREGYKCRFNRSVYNS
jgi:hypothetical protein